jgi:hypothetical protein
MTIARQALWLASIAVGLIGFFLELYSPEKRWKKWRSPWSSKGKIALDEEEEDEEDDTVGGLNGENGTANPYEGIESPVLVANIYERLSFSWLTPLLSLGTQKFLGEEDMWQLPPTDSAEALSSRLSAAWQEQVALVKSGKKSKPSLKIAIAKAYGRVYFVAGLLKGLYDIASFLQPQLLRLLLRFISSYGTDHPMPPVAGFGISILMFISANVATAMLHQYFDRCFSTSMLPWTRANVRGMLTGSDESQGWTGDAHLPQVTRHEQRRKGRTVLGRHCQLAVGRCGPNRRSGAIRTRRLVRTLPDHHRVRVALQFGRVAGICRSGRYGHFSESDDADFG